VKAYCPLLYLSAGSRTAAGARSPMAVMGCGRGTTVFSSTCWLPSQIGNHCHVTVRPSDGAAVLRSWARGFREQGCEKGPGRQQGPVPTHPLFIPYGKTCAEQTGPLPVRKLTGKNWWVE